MLKSFVDSNKKALGESAEELAAKKKQEEKDLRLRLLIQKNHNFKDKEQQTVLEQKAAENVRNLRDKAH